MSLKMARDSMRGGIKLEYVFQDSFASKSLGSDVVKKNHFRRTAMVRCSNIEWKR